MKASMGKMRIILDKHLVQGATRLPETFISNARREGQGWDLRRECSSGQRQGRKRRHRRAQVHRDSKGVRPGVAGWQVCEDRRTPKADGGSGGS